jgi:hypothetical protein
LLAAQRWSQMVLTLFAIFLARLLAPSADVAAPLRCFRTTGRVLFVLSVGSRSGLRHQSAWADKWNRLTLAEKKEDGVDPPEQ